MKSFKLTSFVAAVVAATSIAAVAHAAVGTIAVRRATLSIGEREVEGAQARFVCRDVEEHEGWQFATGCQGTVASADGSPIFRGVLQAIAVNPSEGIGGLAIATPDSTDGKVTCPGSQLQCGPGGKFHAACDAQHGGYEGSDPDSHGIPQTWSCNVP